MEAVFKIVLTTSFYAGIVGMVILLVKNVLKDKLNPRWHYLLWIVLLVKLILPFGPESALSLYNFLEPLSQEIKFFDLPETVGDASTFWSEGAQTGNELPGPPTKGSVASAQDFSTYAADVLPIIWLSGLAFMLVWLIYANVSFAGKLKTHAKPAPPAVQALLEKCKTKAKVKGDIAVLIQDIVKAPSLIGIFKPRILLTPDILRLNEQDISYIMLHELTHYRRKDVWVNHLLLTLQIIHWFNPVIWYCFMRIRQDMEVAADERVLSLLSVNEHKEYGKALLAVLEKINTKTTLMPRLVGMADDRKNIERRIKMIKMADFFNRNRPRIVLTGILCVVLLAGLLWTSASVQATPYEIGDYTFETPADWEVTGSGTELFFSKDHHPLGGVQILNYDPDQPLPVPNHSLTKSKRELPGLITKGILMNFELTQSAASGDNTVLDEKHLYLIFAQDQRVYDFYVSTAYSDEAELIKIGQSIKLKPKSAAQENNADVISQNLEDQLATGQSIEEAVSLAVKGQGKGYLQGEVLTEGHKIVEVEEKDGTVIAYTVASVGWFGFENGIFTGTSGSGAIPTVMTFARNSNGEYSLLEYKEAMDGKGYTESIKRNFPQRLWDNVLSAEHYPELAVQKEAQAKQYLQSIGRDAQVSLGYVEKKLVDINVEASNKLFAELTKWDPELNRFPYWIGTKEYLDQGERFIYETSQNKTSDGYDLITFRKSKEDGKIELEYQYKIVGNELTLVFLQSTPQLKP
ncbi:MULTISPECIES: M56 family metallopeptidase [Desulfitobacterium]|uniref:Antirepressor regulating drug resistance protein n=1 Tax=Desulfitobacterium dehalogenans (strain ATCC 51507 / DSM 9161 / JW/IU-DC1) TaxID=756499 RepID=I4AC65_DESDJ|nr:MULTISPECIES: M56 family metallopeptidase [Desulfitobacterium]AFM01550.1 antirepressor regulating drug resistance protein [Desulfitobacterium dehalogenans ATCC 51507]